MRVLALHARQAEVLVASRARLHSARHHLPNEASVKHPGPCPRPSHQHLSGAFSAFCAACRAIESWKAKRR